MSVSALGVSTLLRMLTRVEAHSSVRCGRLEKFHHPLSIISCLNVCGDDSTLFVPSDI